MRRILAAALAAAVVAMTACKPSEPVATADAWDPAKAQLTEQRLETLTEIARELRDANGGNPVAEPLVLAEVRKRHPATGSDDVLVDGYGRRFRYETVHENTGHSLKTGFRFVSDGANPANVADDVERGAIVEQTASGG